MKKISLNFFGERTTINLPTTLSSLRDNIAEQFLFDPADANELVISYVKEFNKTIVNTELDYKKINDLNIRELTLDINENSRLYQEKKNNAVNTNSKQLKELNKLRKETIEIVAGINQLYGIKSQIIELKESHRNLYQELVDKWNEPRKVIQSNKQLIEAIESSLGIPHEDNKYELKEPKGFEWKKHCHKQKEDKETKTNKEKDSSESKEKKRAYWMNYHKHDDVESSKSKDKKRKYYAKKEDKETKTDKEETQEKYDWKKHIKHARRLQNKEEINTKEAKTEQNSQSESNSSDLNEDLACPESLKIADSPIYCNGCNSPIIKGLIFHCKTCEKFNYCSTCEKKLRKNHRHRLTRIRNPSQKNKRNDHKDTSINKHNKK